MPERPFDRRIVVVDEVGEEKVAVIDRDDDVAHARPLESEENDADDDRRDLHEEWTGVSRERVIAEPSPRDEPHRRARYSRERPSAR